MSEILFYGDKIDAKWGSKSIMLDGRNGEFIKINIEGEIIICQQQYRLSPSKGIDLILKNRNMTEFKHRSLSQKDLGEIEDLTIKGDDMVINCTLVKVDNDVIKTYDKKQIKCLKALRGKSGSCSASILQELCIDYCSIYTFNYPAKIEKEKE